MTADGLILAMTLAMILDGVLGDPPWLPHPVRAMGWAIETLEPRTRALPMRPVAGGAILAMGLVAGVWAASLLLVWLGHRLHPSVGMCIQALMLYTCLSARGLADAAHGVTRALKRSGLAAGQSAVAMIVGRETDRLDETGVTRAAVETVAENLVDGVIAPLFFAFIGGAPLAMAYKMINTLDSMIGYKNERYQDFGRFAARMDDAANYLPARLSVPFIALAAQLLLGRGKQALALARRNGRAHASPNAGWPEAAFAGALNLWMGGPNHYHGRLVDKPVIGKGLGDAKPGHIDQACRLMLISSLLFYLFGVAALLSLPRLV